MDGHRKINTNYVYFVEKKNKCKREMGVMAEELDGSGGCYCAVHC